VKDGQAGEIFEGGCDQIIVIVNAANGWVWIKPGQDGVTKRFRH
jgi:hypothetical protein